MIRSGQFYERHFSVEELQGLAETAYRTELANRKIEATDIEPTSFKEGITLRASVPTAAATNAILAIGTGPSDALRNWGTKAGGTIENPVPEANIPAGSDWALAFTLNGQKMIASGVALPGGAALTSIVSVD